jgi:hypothetical protein
MRRRQLLLIVLCVLTASSCCKKLFEKSEYDIIFKPIPQKGAVTRQKFELTGSMSLNITKGGVVIDSMQHDEEDTFEYTSTILDVSGGEVTMEKLAFENATHVVGGKRVPFGFEGKTVVWGKGGSGEYTFAYEDGSALSAADLEGFAAIVPMASGDVKQNEDEDVLTPGKPIEVGDKWTPDIAKVATQLLNLKSADDVDVAKSQAEFTFVSVEEKNGKDMAHATGTITLHMLEFKGMKFEQPVVLTLEVDGLFRTDATVPDGSMETKITMKGQSPVEVSPGQVADVSISMRTVITRSVESVD